jgi:hypothetical protein
MNVLNQKLYDMLKYHFHEVRVSNGGENMQFKWRWRDDPTGERVRYLDVEHPGEQYQVCCPRCNDTRFRLYVNHRWGMELKDPDGRVHRNLWLVGCFNERCLGGDRDLREDLWEQVTKGSGSWLSKMPIHPGKDVDLEKVVADWPGPVTRVDLLPKTHDAVAYLVSRGFDPKVIGQFYNVHYCAKSVFYLARDRLIIPVYSKGVLKGWQARYIGELKKGCKWPPKYYSMVGMPRRMIVYNFANARRYQTGIIEEGTTDVWRTGPMGMCTLGATMTAQQQRMITNAFEGRSLVLVYDPEEYDKPSTQKLADSLRSSFHGQFANVRLPAGKDPGSMARPWLRSFIAAEAAKQGVKVSWRLATT